MSNKIRVLESSTVIIDNDNASININESLDNTMFNVKINDNNNILSLGVPYPDDNSILYVSYKDAIKVLQKHFILRDSL